MPEEKIVSQKVNLYNLRCMLRAVVTRYEEKKQLCSRSTSQLVIFKEMLSLINEVELNTLMDNTFSLNLFLEQVYSEEESKSIFNKIYQCAYQLKNLYGNDALKDEYNKHLKILNGVVARIIDNYETLYMKSIPYEKEVDNLKEENLLCRGILYRLNTHKYLNNFQIDYIKKLMDENNVSLEHQIIILEYVNNHNINCKFDNPKRSFTTIKMMETEFDLFDTDESITVDEKIKLDAWAISVFDSVMTSEELDFDEFLDDMSKWMDKESSDYALKTVLNKFLSALQECKENMLEGENYFDIELRKLIIMEYNSYYYKFLKIKKYFYNKLLKDNEVDESVLEENYNEAISKKQLLFAMTNNKSYVERDILSVPEEYYSRVKKLLDGFRTGELNHQNIESFSSNSRFRGYKKLKEDQIRIPYRHIGDQNYLILGIMVKKSDRDNKRYGNIISRDYEYDISTSKTYQEKCIESDEVFNNLMEYIEENSRQGNR